VRSAQHGARDRRHRRAGTSYDGELAEQIPPRLAQSINRRGLLVLLVSTTPPCVGRAVTSMTTPARRATSSRPIRGPTPPVSRDPARACPALTTNHTTTPTPFRFSPYLTGLQSPWGVGRAGCRLSSFAKAASLRRRCRPTVGHVLSRAAGTGTGNVVSSSILEPCPAVELLSRSLLAVHGSRSASPESASSRQSDGRR